MRFGLVGTGHWARTVHGVALAEHPDVDLVGVWGRNFDRSAAVAYSLAVAPYESFEQLLDDVDAVAFAVPPDVQAPLAVTAAERGCHLLLEKPVALTTQAADGVVTAVDRSGVRSVVFFTVRFSPNIESWLAASGRDDTWRSGTIRMFGSIFQPGNPFGDSAWRRRWGGLWDIGPHALSVALPLLGPADRVVATRGFADAVELVVHHTGGGTTTCSLSIDAPPGSLGGYWRFYGDATQTEMPEPELSALEAMASCISAVTAEPDQGPPRPVCDVRLGRDVVAVLEAAQRYLDRDIQSQGEPVGATGDAGV